MCLVCLTTNFCGFSLTSYSFRPSLQALYFCVPFREQLLEYYGNNKSIGDAEENLLTCLADLFSQVTTNESDSEVSCYACMHDIPLDLVCTVPPNCKFGTWKHASFHQGS